jgi:excisionase family DNA binding protein
VPHDDRAPLNMRSDTSTSALPLALTVAEAATIAGVSARTMYRAIDAGTIPIVRLTPRGRVFIPRHALERFLADGR